MRKRHLNLIKSPDFPDYVEDDPGVFPIAEEYEIAEYQTEGLDNSVYAYVPHTQENPVPAETVTIRKNFAEIWIWQSIDDRWVLEYKFARSAF